MNDQPSSRVRDNSKGFRGRQKESTRHLIQQDALIRGAARSSVIRERVIRAMSLIDEDIRIAGGRYPMNKGVISAAEVARRAGINETTLYSPKHSEALGKEVAEKVKFWNSAIFASKNAKSKKAGRTRSERAADWKEMYGRLAQAHRDTELDLQSMQRKLEVAIQELNELRQQYREMLAFKAPMQNVRSLRDPAT